MNQTKNLRRVRREDRPPAERRTDGLDVCLDCWIAWMGQSDTDLSTQTMKTLQGDGDGYGNSDTAQNRRDREVAIATDAMIHSLTSRHRWAIHRKSGLSTAWRFPQLDYLTEAIEACGELEKKLRGNVATRMLFL